jgi:hypothetical protein
MDKPPTKAKPSAEAEHAPEPRKVKPAPVVRIAGRRVRIPKAKGDGSVSWQRLKGHPSQGAELVSLTRWAIAVCDGEPLEVVQTVIARLPEAVLAKCQKVSADRVEISRKIERHLLSLQSAMIERRRKCREAHPDVEQISKDHWRGTSADLDSLAAAMEAVDQANLDLLRGREWREIPEKVLHAILTGLDYPKPGNLTEEPR